MKQKKDNIFLIILHIIAALAIMLISQLIGSTVAGFIPGDNGALKSIVQTIIYILLTVFVGLMYVKYVMHCSFEEMGVEFKAPELIWVVIGFVLPLMITAFYMLFTRGQLIKNDTGAGLSYYLIVAIFSHGLGPGICEDFIFRGPIMRIFERRWNKTIAVVVPSVLFALLHLLNGQLGLVDILLLLIGGTLAGVMFSLIAMQTGSIWSGAIVHAIWDAIIIGGVIFIGTSDNVTVTNYLYKYDLFSNSLLLTGGRFGIETALPAIIGYILVCLIAFTLMEKSSD